MRAVALCWLSLVPVLCSAQDLNSTKKDSITQKALFKGKAYYDKRIQKKYENTKREKNVTVSQEKKPLPRRSDGSIDTYKFLNEKR